MRSISISRPTPSMIVAIVALVMALGGTSYAAATLSGKSIKKRSLPADRIVSNALTGSQINEKRLGIVPMSNVAKFADQAKNAGSADTARTAETAKSATTATTAETAKTADTAKSADDAKLLQGKPATAFMASQVRLVTAQSGVTPTNTSANVAASCTADEKAIGGGAAWLTAAGNPSTLEAPLHVSMPIPATAGTDTMTGWRAVGRNLTGFDRVLHVFVSCVPKTA
jgi:hypothetical protein